MKQILVLDSNGETLHKGDMVEFRAYGGILHRGQISKFKRNGLLEVKGCMFWIKPSNTTISHNSVPRNCK